jgi:hypothetical protein
MLDEIRRRLGLRRLGAIWMSGLMVDESLRHHNGLKASISDTVPIALMKIMENEGGSVS